MSNIFYEPALEINLVPDVGDMLSTFSNAAATVS